MKTQEGFGKFISGIIGLLIWLLPIGGGITGIIITINTSSSYYRSSIDPSDLIIPIIIGLLAGFLADIFILGPIVILINIQNYLEDIRNKLYNKNAKLSEKKENEQRFKETEYRSTKDLSNNNKWICRSCGTENEIYLLNCKKCGKEFNEDDEV
jgi:ribosomal protein L40E